MGHRFLVPLKIICKLLSFLIPMQGLLDSWGCTQPIFVGILLIIYADFYVITLILQDSERLLLFDLSY
jgi:uncharacterized membrane protein